MCQTEFLNSNECRIVLSLESVQFVQIYLNVLILEFRVHLKILSPVAERK